MTITSTFFSGRAAVRTAKAELGGKIIDNGAGAETGKRWELQHELLAVAGAGESQTQPDELTGVPSVGTSAVLDDLAGAVFIDDVSTAMDELAAIEQAQQAQREVLAKPKDLRYTGTRELVLTDRKNKAINVIVKRSTIAARLTAHMAK
jgi:hypothetical protein